MVQGLNRILHAALQRGGVVIVIRVAGLVGDKG